MARSLDELKAALKDESLMEDIVNLIETERNKGIELHRKQNNENANLRKYKKALEVLGYEDGDIDEFTSSMIDLKTRSTTNHSDSLTLKSLNDQIKTLTKTIDDERGLRKGIEKQAQDRTIAAKLTQALSDKVYGADLLVRSLIQDGKVGLDGDEVIFRDNETVLPFNDGLNKLLETRKDIVKTNQKTGSNTFSKEGGRPDLQQIAKSGDSQLIRQNLNELVQAYGLRPIDGTK
jgi:small-conductance mechanosensitive channel